MTEFRYSDMFPLGDDTTEYKLLTDEYVSNQKFQGQEMLVVDPAALSFLAEKAFKDVSHLCRPSHMALLKKITEDPEASDNDKYIATELIKNAVIAAEMTYPMCQDTGTAIIMGKKGQAVWTGCDDKKEISKGAFDAYTSNFLRYSQNAPITMYEEKNTGSNLPAQIDISAEEGSDYKFLFVAKGGGSANKTFLYQETKAVLNPEKLVSFMIEKMKTLGTAACPPYHIAFAVGGTSAELNLKTVKMASAGYLDHLPTKGDITGHAFRDVELEKTILEESRKLGYGAQFGGKYFAHDIRIIRLPRHGASCPVGLGVSCSADRNIKAKITKEGIFLEKLETNPAQYLPVEEKGEDTSIRIDLSKPMDDIRAELSKHPVSTRVLLNGKIIVGRDIAHAKFKESLDAGDDVKHYLKDHIIYYAGPAKTPTGEASGSFGPTTAGRMDSYVSLLQNLGGSMVMLAKGNRSQAVTDSCKENGGFYLGSPGGTAARIGRDCIKNVEVLEYKELGMEAVFMITVKDFPAFIIVDDKGNDFYQQL